MAGYMKLLKFETNGKRRLFIAIAEPLFPPTASSGRPQPGLA